jgi:hypothetical protein
MKPMGRLALALLAGALAGCGGGVASSASSSAAPALDTTSRLLTAQPSAADPSATPGTAPRCTPAQVSAAASTDRPTYRQGDPVSLTTTLTNHSSQPCSLSVSAHDPGFSVSGGSGEVWRNCGPGQSCPLYERLVVLPPGGRQSVSAAWDQHTCGASACNGPPPPAGAYQAKADWADLGSATAPFTVG